MFTLRWLGRLALAVVFQALLTQTAAAQVVVFAPHPDDEALIASGVIARAKSLGQNVKVVLATNGDCEDSTIGHQRQQETIAAMGVLGVPAQDVIFLGYPDCGLRELYYYYTTPTSQYTSRAGFDTTYGFEGLGLKDYHSYIYGAPALYSGYSLLQDLTTVLRNYRPQDIYVTSLWDNHTDHYALDLLLTDAIVNRMKVDPAFQPTLHEAIVHEPCEECDPNYHWPMPSFTPTVRFSAPPYLNTTPLAWSNVTSIDVPTAMQSTVETTNQKYQAISRYGSQVSPWLFSFVKRDEIFWNTELWSDKALTATGSASSFNTPGTMPDRLNDGIVGGNPKIYLSRGGRGEWVSNNEFAGAWAQLTWSSAQSLTKIVLHDRPDTTENITAGVLSFSDGSTIPVGALPTSGAPLTVTFATKSVTWVRFTVTSGVGTAVGLAEIEAFGATTAKQAWSLPPANNPPSITSGPTATSVSITDAQTTNVSATGSDPNGDALTYTWVASGGMIQGSGSTITFVPPAVSTLTTFRITVYVADGRGGVVSSWTEVNVTASGTPQNIAWRATSTASSENSDHGQTADKATDGVVGGYPTDAQREWATRSQLAGAWIQLTWPTAQTISRAVLHDRINNIDQILGGTLQFSDGSSVAVGTLPNDGTGLSIPFVARTVTWVRFTVTSAVGGSAGLAEFEVFTAPPVGSNTAPQIGAGPTATPSSITSAQSSSLTVSASDADGDTLTYSWQAAQGTITGSGATVTFTPPNVASTTTIRVDVVVLDGRGGSASGFVNVTVNPVAAVANIATFATATASAENSSRDQTAAKAIDGVVDGYPTGITNEWVAPGQLAGAWLQLTWASPQTLSRVVLHDRINTSDQVLTATLRFSDGSTVAVPSLPNDGAGLAVDFASRSVSWVRFEVNSARGDNTGLAEMEVYTPSGAANHLPLITAGPTAAPATINDLQNTSVSVTATDQDGDVLSYVWTASGGTVNGTGATVTFTPPRITSPTTFRITVTVNDGHGGSASGFVDVPVTPTSTALNLAQLATASASSENSSRGQNAASAIDGSVDGYPTNPAAEWASVGQLAGAWIQLTWQGARTVSRVVLHDRINTDDQVLSATLTFSDGSTATVGTLPNDGVGLEIQFPAKSITWMRLTVNTARGANIGLAEFEAY